MKRPFPDTSRLFERAHHHRREIALALVLTAFAAAFLAAAMFASA